MKISFRWLSEYIDLADYQQNPQALAEVLTRAGLEVEEIQSPGRELHHVVIGHILEKDKHPNADKLSLCRITTGEGQVHQIVCGAQNHSAGDRVVVALPGAVLPGNFAIKKSVIRGIESSGMLCSYKELGMQPTTAEGAPPSLAGIIILPPDAPVGKIYTEYAGLNDVLFELKVTPNRADCLSHYGLARELSALLGRGLCELKPSFKLSEEKSSARFQVEVLAQDLCPRYMGRLIRQVKVGPSPDWLKQRLEAVGLTSINNIVDVTNFVLMELGQPLHAFDADRIEGQQLRIDRAQAQEEFTTLDGSQLKLKGEELTIRDSKKALCLAGTIGGKESGVSAETQNLFLESAYFLAKSVRKTSRGHGIETESSYRFSRGVDPQGVALALDRATQLILDIAGGEATREPFDLLAEISERRWIAMTTELITNRLGYLAETSRAIDIFRRLGCEIKLPAGELTAKSEFSVKPPSYRFDLEQDMDFVEEYARVIGYAEIPETLPPLQQIPTLNDPVFDLGQKLGSTLRSMGFSQAWNYAFVRDSDEEKMIGERQHLAATGLSTGLERVRVMNPLNEELNTMRVTLSHGLLRNVISNSHRGNASGRLYETGMTFGKQDKTQELLLAKTKSGTPYIEKLRLALVTWGFTPSLWEQKSRAPGVFAIKSALEEILIRFGISDFEWKNGDFSKAPSFLHAGQWASLWVQGQTVGFIGSLHPQILEQEKIRESVALGEIEIEFLLGQVGRSFRAKGISKFPAVERDYAFLIPVNVPVQSVAKTIEQVVGPLGSDVKVFDVYQGPELPAEIRSVAFSLRLQGMDATLQETEITEVHQKILKSVKEKFGISAR